MFIRMMLVIGASPTERIRYMPEAVTNTASDPEVVDGMMD